MKKYKFFVIAFLMFIMIPFQVSAMQIQVQKPSMETLTLEVESSDTIEAVKQKIQLQDGTLPEKQKLFLEGTLLEDGRTLGDYTWLGLDNSFILEYVIKVVFDANGGNFGTDTTYTVDDWNANLYDSLVSPTRDGYKFMGYYTEKNGGTKFEMILNESGIDSDMTFYAKWEVVTENPKTFDGIGSDIFIGIISLIGLFGAAIYLKNKVRA